MLGPKKEKNAESIFLICFYFSLLDLYCRLHLYKILLWRENYYYFFIQLKFFSVLQHCCQSMHMQRAQHFAVVLHRTQNKRIMRTCCAESLTGFKLHAITSNKSQKELTCHANGRNMLRATYACFLPVAQQCCCVRFQSRAQCMPYVAESVADWHDLH